MKLINPSFEILEQTPGIQGVKKQIELAGRTCYSEDTEVLTNNGWKFFPDVNKDDFVLSYNPTTNTLIWDDPNMITKTIVDNMIEIEHANIKLCVTKDHRILQSTPLDRNYSFLTAEQLLGTSPIPGSKQSRFRIPKYFIGSKRTEIEIPTIRHTKEVKHGFRHSTLETVEFTVNPAFMVIAGAFISEGHTNHREKYGSGSNCQITQDCNSLLYDNVIEALEDLQWSYKINSDPRKTNIKWITFGNSVLVDLFDSLFGRGSRNKHLPEWFRKLPNEYLQILLENLYLGDGTHNATRKERYISISKRLLDEIQEVFILLGKNASYTFDEEIPQKCTLEESTRDSWIVDRKKHIKITDCKERTVYCTSTESGIICVRYKGKTCWCGNCYKSEDKITDTSCEEFVNRMVNSGHGAMLEHGTVYLKIYAEKKEKIVNEHDYARHISWQENKTVYKYLDDKYLNNKYSKVVRVDHRKQCDVWYPCSYITTNYRVLVENGWLDDLQYQCEPTEYHEKRITVKFIFDRGVSHEFVRHRVFSFAQESTRYCNYSKDKFNEEITFIKPIWLEESTMPQSDWESRKMIESNFDEDGVWYEECYKYTGDTRIKNSSWQWNSADWFYHQLKSSETTYLQLLKQGWKPQQARAVLPNALKTELIMTGFVSDWEHFFKLRCHPTAHPQARELAVPLKEEFVKKGYLNG